MQLNIKSIAIVVEMFVRQNLHYLGLLYQRVTKTYLLSKLCNSSSSDSVDSSDSCNSSDSSDSSESSHSSHSSDQEKFYTQKELFFSDFFLHKPFHQKN